MINNVHQGGVSLSYTVKKQEYIPVGCVPTAGWPYPRVVCLDAPDGTLLLLEDRPPSHVTSDAYWEEVNSLPGHVTSNACWEEADPLPGHVTSDGCWEEAEWQTILSVGNKEICTL